MNFLVELRKWCHENQIQVSDRRWRKIVHMLKVSAFTNGQSTVSIWDCWLVQHCIWEKPEQVELVAAMYEQYCGKAVINVDNLVKVVEVLEKEVGKLPKPNNNVHKASHQQSTRSQTPTGDLIEINAPVFPESVADGTIATWHVEINEKITKDQTICQIETDKVVLEVVAPCDGMIYAIIKDEGDTVLSNEAIAILASSDTLKTKSSSTQTLTNNRPKTLGALLKAQQSKAQ